MFRHIQEVTSQERNTFSKNTKLYFQNIAFPLFPHTVSSMEEEMSEIPTASCGAGFDVWQQAPHYQVLNPTNKLLENQDLLWTEVEESGTGKEEDSM